MFPLENIFTWNIDCRQPSASWVDEAGAATNVGAGERLDERSSAELRGSMTRPAAPDAGDRRGAGGRAARRWPARRQLLVEQLPRAGRLADPARGGNPRHARARLRSRRVAADRRQPESAPGARNPNRPLETDRVGAALQLRLSAQRRRDLGPRSAPTTSSSRTRSTTPASSRLPAVTRARRRISARRRRRPSRAPPRSAVAGE